MMVRKSKKGTVRSVFLTEEGSDYSSSVINLFATFIGKRIEEIEDGLKALELKSQNPKIVKGLALIMFRMSRIEPPSLIDPVTVREMVFSKTKVPPVSPGERDEILGAIAKEMNSSITEIRKAMYADKESEQILISLPEITPDSLSRRFNSEQIETVMLKAKKIKITSSLNIPRIIRTARRLGLLYRVAERDAVEISGPLSVTEGSERYGSSFALFTRQITRLGDWQAEAIVSLRDGKKEKEYAYSINNSVSEYSDSFEEENHYGFVQPKEFVKLKDGQVIFDYTFNIEDKNVNIFVTRPRYYQEDYFTVKNAREEGINAEIFCIVHRNEKCPSGAICFKDSVDWIRAKEFVETKYSGKEINVERYPVRKIGEISAENRNKIFGHLENLYPDSQAMVDYIEFMGLDPSKTLEEAGFKVKWKGLRIIVQK
jgi:predicted nuclease of restriction endonuclease-like RecB superfamily